MSTFLRLLKIRFLITTVLTTIFMMSCSKKKDDEDEGNGAALELTGSAALVGSWTGNYNAVDSDGKMVGDYRGVELTLFDNTTFELKMKDDAAAVAKGKWLEFHGTSLFLSVKESTLSHLRPSPSDAELYYDLTGNSLHLQSENKFELKLSRKAAAAKAEDEQSVISKFEGTWACVHGDLTTRLSIGANLQWRGLIQAEGGGLGILSGGGELMSDDGLKLVIVSSNYDVTPNSLMTMISTQSNTNLSMTVDGKQESLGTCSRD